MDKPIHRFSELFEQLGLPADEQAIGQFITAHSPLAASIDLDEALNEDA